MYFTTESIIEIKKKRVTDIIGGPKSQTILLYVPITKTHTTH